MNVTRLAYRPAEIQISWISNFYAYLNNTSTELGLQLAKMMKMIQLLMLQIRNRNLVDNNFCSGSEEVSPIISITNMQI